MPTVDLDELHAGQLEILEQAGRFNVLACGRRFGKTTTAKELVFWPAHDGYPVGYFVPEYKLLTEVWEEWTDTFAPLIRRTDKQQRRIQFTTGGRIECWAFDRSPNAGRSRKYKRVIVDEAAHCANLKATWQKCLRPTLTDFKGDAWFLSSPRGQDFFHELYKLGQDPKRKAWRSWRKSSYDNPHLDPSEIDEARDDLPPEVFGQEYLAEFLAEAFGKLIADLWVDRCAEVPARPPYPVGRPRMGVDLGEGTGRNQTVLYVVDDAGILARDGGSRTGLADAAMLMKRHRDLWGISDDRMAYDANGLGKDLPKYLEPLRIAAVPYHGGGKGGPRWFNRRARCAWRIRQRLDPGRPDAIAHPQRSDSPWRADRPAAHTLQPPFALPADRGWWPRLSEELKALRYEVDGKVIKLERKEDMAGRLGRSPDDLDALVMAFSVGDFA